MKFIYVGSVWEAEGQFATFAEIQEGQTLPESYDELCDLPFRMFKFSVVRNGFRRASVPLIVGGVFEMDHEDKSITPATAKFTDQLNDQLRTQMKAHQDARAQTRALLKDQEKLNASYLKTLDPIRRAYSRLGVNERHMLVLKVLNYITGGRS